MCSYPPFPLGQVLIVNFEADEFRHAALLSSQGGVPDPKKRIEHRLRAADAMQLNAIHRQLDRERRGMRPFFVAALDRLVRHEPGVAAATQIASACVTPTRDVALVLIRHAKREAIHRRRARGC